MIFQSDYKSVIEDYTKDGRLGICAVLKILENAGNGHSDYAGDSVFKAGGITRAWVLTEWQIEVSEFPRYADSVRTETWSEELKSPLVANRNFLMYKNGAVFAKAATRWVLFDVQNQRLCKIAPELIAKYGPEDRTVFDSPKLAKIEIPAAFDAEKRIALRRKDFDFNGHVHNLVYLDYAMECLPEDVYERQNFRGLRITYKSAVTEGREVICRYAGGGEQHAGGGKRHTVLIYSQDEKLCTMIQLEE